MKVYLDFRKKLYCLKRYYKKLIIQKVFLIVSESLFTYIIEQYFFGCPNWPELDEFRDDGIRKFKNLLIIG